MTSEVVKGRERARAAQGRNNVLLTLRWEQCPFNLLIKRGDINTIDISPPR